MSNSFLTTAQIVNANVSTMPIRAMAQYTLLTALFEKKIFTRKSCFPLYCARSAPAKTSNNFEKMLMRRHSATSMM